MVKKIIKIVLIVILVIVFIFAALIGYSIFQNNKSANNSIDNIMQIKNTGDDQVTFANTFTIVDLDGNTYGPEVFANADITVINIWATDCSPCVHELPDINELAAQYKDKGLQIIGVCTGSLGKLYSSQDADTKKQIEKEFSELVEALGLNNYIQGVPSDEFGLDLLANVLAVYPTTVVVDSNGEVIDAFAGSQKKAEWAAKFDGYIAKG